AASQCQARRARDSPERWGRMTQNDFNRAFAKQAFSHAPPTDFDPRCIVEEMLRRDQLLARVFAALSLFFWLVATAGMLLLVYGLNRFVLYVRIAQFPS